MKDMPSLIKDKSMTPSYVTSFVCILSSFLKLPTNSDQHTTKSHCKSVTSPLIYNFDDKSKVHSGERLIKLYIRHAMDKVSPSVIDGNISVGSHNDEMVIIFDNEVKPSMIKSSCNTKICFNGEHIVLSVCDYKSGCKVHSSLIERNEKNVRTHEL